MASRENEEVSPVGKLFLEASMNCYVIASMGSKTRINPEVIREGLCQTLLKHPRFTSKLVKEGRTRKWIPTTVNLDNHIIVPEIDSNIEHPDRFVEDYISHFTKTPLDLSKPLWELHLLNIKTSDAEAVAIFRIHHSVGDGASLISLLLAATRKTSDPHALPTVPTKNRNSERHRSWLFSIWWGLLLIWHTLVDMLLFTLTIFFIRDTPTPLKGAPGVALNTKRFVNHTVSMDDIKLIKNQMQTTVNDVLLGVTQAALTLYLNRAYDQEANFNGAKGRSSALKNIRLRASILVNIRPVGGIQVAAAITERVLFNTSIAFSNVAGPVEEISFLGHPVAYIAPSVYGHPQALTIHFQSYANKMTISLAVDPLVIPDPYLLCDDFEQSLKLIRDAVQRNNVVHLV
ncbi:O-acyltransferase WSD1-like isoform X3 [Vigna unguiculata]|uniref:O-acyltransferase WSD1-like isoform X3 n=1 Tax=Vigna unguiculata TaxID=3917 RepID=UPI001016CA9A|nr:O-acyltransferase WSD1-like isoform X3 [Vigna unguiculata]